MLTKTLRPLTLSKIFGQDHILKDFKNRSKKIDFPDVMILEGESGTGKSTSAMIIAKLLNCKHPVLNAAGYYEPCNECVSCLDIIEEKYARDVILLDASSMGKEDVLNIEQKVSYAPMFDSNKIVIIEEAQELTKAGKGATLKLLEKVRKNTHFILCTMNIESFDKAVKSRGVTYRFKALPSSVISDALFEYCKNYEEENDIKLPDEFMLNGIFILAEEAQGSLRQAVSFLEKAIYSETYTEDDIKSSFGFISDTTLLEFLKELLDKDPNALLQLQTFDVKEIFYKTRKILLETSIFHCTGVVDADWKKAGYVANLKHDTFWELFDMIFSVEDFPYFKENDFKYKLVKYMSKGKNTDQTNVLSQENEIPKRRKIIE